MEVTPYETLIKQEEALTLQLKVVRDYIKAFYPDKKTAEESEQEAMLLAQSTRFEQNKPNKTRTIRKKATKKPRSKITVPDMVLSALSAIGTGKTKDVAEKMIEMYVVYQKNKEKAIKDARFHISALKNKKVEVVEEGIGNSGSVYKLITAA